MNHGKREMRFKTLAATISFALLIFAASGRAQISAVQRKSDPNRPGDVRIEFYGHDAFKITSPDGLTVLTDPWRNDSTGQYPKWFLREFPAIRVDIVVSTHVHFDHDAVERPQALMGLADKHKEMDLENAIEIIETGGLRIAVWGDNRAEPDPFLDDYLKNVDVLILPVDSVLTRAEVDAIVARYNPKAVIPSHYSVTGLTTSVSGLESADGWVNYQEKARYVDEK